MRSAAGHGRHRLRPALGQYRDAPDGASNCARTAGPGSTGLRSSSTDVQWHKPPAQPAMTSSNGRSRCPCPTGADCGIPDKPAHPCATQQPKQQRFRLIVTVLGRSAALHWPESTSTERAITRIPRRTLKAGARLNLHAHHLQRHAQRITDGLAMLPATHRPQPEGRGGHGWR